MRDDIALFGKGLPQRHLILDLGLEIGSGIGTRDHVIIGQNLGKALGGQRLVQIGVDPLEDRKRFQVSPKGITLVTAEMLGQGAAAR